MPLYEYRCSSCRHEFTTLRPMSRADDLPPCSTCGSSQVERKPSTFAVIREATVGVGRQQSGGGCACGGACGCGAHN